jgi:hypothetical protein
VGDAAWGVVLVAPAYLTDVVVGLLCLTLLLVVFGGGWEVAFAVVVGLLLFPRDPPLLL